MIGNKNPHENTKIVPLYQQISCIQVMHDIQALRLLECNHCMTRTFTAKTYTDKHRQLLVLQHIITR